MANMQGGCVSRRILLIHLICENSLNWADPDLGSTRAGGKAGMLILLNVNSSAAWLLPLPAWISGKLPGRQDRCGHLAPNCASSRVVAYTKVPSDIAAGFELR